MTKSLASAGQTFPCFGTTLSDSQIDTLYLAPTSVDLVSSVAATGGWFANASTANVVANTGSGALGYFSTGDWITIVGNTSQVDLKQVIQVVKQHLPRPRFGALDHEHLSLVLSNVPQEPPDPAVATIGARGETSRSNGTLLTVNLVSQ